MMLQNENCSQNEDNFCSSCKSVLQSIYSLGLPSYLDESVSDISSFLQDDSQKQEIVNDEMKTMQSVSTLMVPNQNKLSASLSPEKLTNTYKSASLNNSQIESPKLSLEYADDSSHIASQTKTDERNTLTNVTLWTYQAQQLNKIMYKQMYSFISLRNRKVIVDNSENECRNEKPNLLSSLKSCHFNECNAQEMKPSEKFGQTVFNICSLERLKEIREILSKNKARVQASVVSKASVVSQNPIDVKTETDLKNRRQNIYKLAVRISKLSAYIQNIHKVLLKEPNGAKTYEDNVKNKVSTIQSYTKHNTVQDLPMYNYNPLRMKKGVKHVQ